MPQGVLPFQYEFSTPHDDVTGYAGLGLYLDLWAAMGLDGLLDQVMKQLVLGGTWANRRIKAMRFAFIRVAGRVVTHARRLVIRLSQELPTKDTFIEARASIAHLAQGPPTATAAL